MKLNNLCKILKNVNNIFFMQALCMKKLKKVTMNFSKDKYPAKSIDDLSPCITCSDLQTRMGNSETLVIPVIIPE